MIFFLWLVSIAFAVAFGYWVASHPSDARDIAQRLRDAMGRLINRMKGKP